MISYAAIKSNSDEYPDDGDGDDDGGFDAVVVTGRKSAGGSDPASLRVKELEWGRVQAGYRGRRVSGTKTTAASYLGITEKGQYEYGESRLQFLYRFFVLQGFTRQTLSAAITIPCH